MTVSSLGIGSGIDLQGILDGLMAIERNQQTLLKSKVTSQQSKISTYQTLNGQFQGLKTAAEALNLPSSWQAFKATSSDASVTATADSSAISGTFSFKVTGLAQAHVLASSGTVASLDAVINSNGDTLSEVVSNINTDDNSPFSAAAIQVAPNQYKLQLTAKESGSANSITTDTEQYSAYGLGSLQTVAAASDATLQVGNGPGAYTITSASNTIQNALPGVTLQLTSADPDKTVTVKVAGDVDKLANNVEAMVKAANTALSYIKDNSKYNPDTSAAGSLLGNSVASRLSQQIYSQLLGPVSGASLSTVDQVGIKTDASGLITFDKEKFKAEYAKNPQAVASMFVEGGVNGTATPTNPGLAERMANLGKLATNSVDGIITSAIKGHNTTIDDLKEQIERWDDRLAQRESTLKRQFSALDVAISNYQSMGSWLSGQIGSLPSWG